MTKSERKHNLRQPQCRYSTTSHRSVAYFHIGLTNKLTAYLPGLWESRDGNVAEAHDDGKERVKILVVFAAATAINNSPQFSI